MDLETSHWAALGVGVVFNLVMLVVLLRIQNAVLASEKRQAEALNEFRERSDERYESKELAVERHQNLIERINQAARVKAS